MRAKVSEAIGLAIGAYPARYEPAWAVTGDFAFIAAGHLGPLEAAQKNICRLATLARVL